MNGNELLGNYEGFMKALEKTLPPAYVINSRTCKALQSDSDLTYRFAGILYKHLVAWNAANNVILEQQKIIENAKKNLYDDLHNLFDKKQKG